MLPGHQPLEPVPIPRMPQREHGILEKQDDRGFLDTMLTAQVRRNERE